MVIIIAFFIFIISGCFWYVFFRRRENQLLDHLQDMVDNAASGKLSRSNISETKLSRLEDSMKRYMDNTMSEGKNQKNQKEIIQNLISDISHQTLTPVSNLKLYAGLLDESGYEDKEITSTIVEQTDKLDFLIQSLIHLSRMESGIIKVCPEITKVSVMLNKAWQQYASAALQKNITYTMPETNLTACFDIKWTAEAVGNIIDNALKYTEENGYIKINVCEYSFFVRIDISDNGIGIDSKEIPRIFTRFYRSFSVSDLPGVGIGLYLSREIIKSQNGYIKVSSEPGKGSVFSVFLPKSS